MKTLLRNLVAFLLTAIYCFAIGIVINSYSNTEFHKGSNKERETNFSAVSTTLFNQIQESESVVNIVNGHPESNFKNPFDEIWALVNTSNVLFESKYAQYLKSSKNFLILYRKADLIFPFHYFW